MRLVTVLLAMAALAACAPAVPPAETLAPALPQASAPAAAFPGVDVNATAACVKENATEGELAIMALGDARSQAVTAEVLARPATQACLTRAGVTLPGTPAP